jgi:hypothetical protein
MFQKIKELFVISDRGPVTEMGHGIRDAGCETRESEAGFCVLGLGIRGGARLKSPGAHTPPSPVSVIGSARPEDESICLPRKRQITRATTDDEWQVPRRGRIRKRERRRR